MFNINSIKEFLLKILRFFKILDLPSLIIFLLNENDKEYIKNEILNAENIGLSKGYEKRIVVVDFVLAKWINKLDYDWLSDIFNSLPKDKRRYLANSIVELLFFEVKNTNA